MDKNIQDVDEIIDKGDLVFSHFWDSGAPGPGADFERIYRYKGKYYPVLSYEDEILPYNSIEEALEETELSTLNEASEEVEFLSDLAGTILPLLQYNGEKTITVRINGEAWMAMPDVGLRRF